MSIVRHLTSSLSDENHVRCQSCAKVIGKLSDEGMIPSAEQCYKDGNVPIPNLGWFCNQECAGDFEKKYDVKFARTEEGIIDYYK